MADQSSGAETSRTHIEVAYAGPPGVMDVEELAPALMGLAALCKRANDEFNGDYATVTVNVRSDFKTASFGIDLDVVQTVAVVGAALPLLTPQNFKSAKDLAELIGLIATGDEKSFTSLLGLVKWLRGSRIERATPIENTNTFAITNERGDNIIINGDVERLIFNGDIRDAAHQALKPLERPAITGFQVKRDGEVVEHVPDDAVAFFHHEEPVPLPVHTEEVLADSTGQHAFEVIRPSFDPTLMWTMSDGSRRHIWVKVEDQGFLDEVRHGVEFRAGSVVVGVYRIRSTRTTSGKVQTNYSLMNKIEIRHPKPPTDPPLFR